MENTTLAESYKKCIKPELCLLLESSMKFCPSFLGPSVCTNLSDAFKPPKFLVFNEQLKLTHASSNLSSLPSNYYPAWDQLCFQQLVNFLIVWNLPWFQPSVCSSNNALELRFKHFKVKLQILKS